MRRSLVAVSLAALALPLLVACGDDTDDASDAGATTGPTIQACIDEATLPEASAKVGSAPDIQIPDSAPPCDLVVEDLKKGEGKAVKDVTKTYEWNYEGVSWSTGEVFDSSFTSGQPAPFSLNMVIPGWTEGLQGMKPGGRRMLVIPPDQAYGDTPRAGSGIAPGETLVFVVDLVGPAPTS